MYADREAAERWRSFIRAEQKKARKQAGGKSGFRKVCKSHR
jgi:hypothetical protein